MGSLSDYSELALLNHICNNTLYTPAATLYLALCTADPTDAATGASMSEVANAGGYVRQAITFGTAASRAIAQNALITFPVVTVAWGTVSHFAIVDSATYGSGNVLAAGAFAVAKVAGLTTQPKVSSGEIIITFATGGISTYLANKLLDLMFRNQTYTRPATYVGIATSTLSDTTTGTTVAEPSGGAYARTLVNPSGGASPAWNAASAGAVTNANAITPTTPSANWGSVTAAFTADAATLGNILFYDNAVTPQTIYSGDPVSWAIGAFSNQIS